MNSTLKSYEGMVFFVDILGFSALTKGLVNNITTKDYEAWGLYSDNEQNHSMLAATILVEFRDVLQKLTAKYPDIHVGQLSDCAFIWSDDVLSVLKAVHFVMWTMIEGKGILCRGGIAYGEIVQVDNVDYKLGAFIVGDAVTRAVKNEGRLKGPRVSMDVEFPDVLWRTFGSNMFISQMSADLLHPNNSEIDMSVVDEYRWYLFQDDYLDNVYVLPFDKLVDLTKRRLQLSNYLRYHPRMGWNSRSSEGLLQLRAGVKSLSVNGACQVLHYFETDNVNEEERKLSIYTSMNDKIDRDTGYFPKSDIARYQSHLEDLD